jgi:hypothetical protein
MLSSDDSDNDHDDDILTDIPIESCLNNVD